MRCASTAPDSRLKKNTSLRGAKRRGDQRECLWCNPLSFAGTTNGRFRSISGIATSGCALLAMTCSLFVPVLLFVIHPSAAFGGRNAGDGVPYGDICRDTPPGVSGSTRPRVGDTRGRRSLRGDPPKRVGATLAVVPVRTTKKDRVKFPRHCEERSDAVTEGIALQPRPYGPRFWFIRGNNASYCDGGDRGDRKGRPYAFWGITP